MSRIRRRGAIAALIAALSAGGTVLAATPASASALLTVQVGAGVFNGRSTTSGLVGVPDLYSGDVLLALCWNTGQDLGRGDHWYLTVYERYKRFNGLELTVTGWTYAPYVDNTAASLPHC